MNPRWHSVARVKIIGGEELYFQVWVPICGCGTQASLCYPAFKNYTALYFKFLSSYQRNSIKLVEFSGFLKCFNDTYFFPFRLYMGIHKCCYPAWFVQFKCLICYCHHCCYFMF